MGPEIRPQDLRGPALDLRATKRASAIGSKPSDQLSKLRRSQQRFASEMLDTTITEKAGGAYRHARPNLRWNPPETTATRIQTMGRRLHLKASID
jgi:hypothetical protein